MEEEEICIPVNGKRISNLRYANDSAIIMGNMEHLQRMVDKISNTGHEYCVIKCRKNKTNGRQKRANATDR